ncbi:hypothetical protein [Williamsoniiplasma luminosum]|uniref:Uncharacterized protein n=1 Tax=Williamsoniiplasma luminosum TaxID=214888 RepID=A0A2S0NK54_9MOLU|nr:hypothetical protein [Williamsoniiplasma luminosum]AVP49385.1 MAG: hypothetical protein C5T88_02185 [Williamsoniiplasma luminosum]
MRKKFVYIDLFKSLIEEEILLLKYNPDVNEDLKVKQMIHFWDSTHDIVAFNSWVKEEISKLELETFVPNDLDETREQDEFLWEMLLLKQNTLMDVILTFNYEYELVKKVKTFATWPEYERIRLAYLHQIRNFYDQFREELKEFNAPFFIHQGMKTVKEHIDKIPETVIRIDETLFASKDLHEYLSDLLDSLENLELSLNDQELEAANTIVNWMLYVAGILYNVLLMSEKFAIVEDKKRGIELTEQFYEIVEEREVRLEMLKMISDQPKN